MLTNFGLILTLIQIMTLNTYISTSFDLRKPILTNLGLTLKWRQIMTLKP